MRSVILLYIVFIAGLTAKSVSPDDEVQLLPKGDITVDGRGETSDNHADTDQAHKNDGRPKQNDNIAKSEEDISSDNVHQWETFLQEDEAQETENQQETEEINLQLSNTNTGSKSDTGAGLVIHETADTDLQDSPSQDNPSLEVSVEETGSLEDICYQSACWGVSEAKNAGLRERVEELENQLEQLQEVVRDLQENQDVIKGSMKTIHFYARLNEQTTVLPDQTVRFDSVIEETGTGYDPSTGVFTCPITGVYSFASHLTSRQQQSYFILFKTNGAYGGMTLNPRNAQMYSDTAAVSVLCEEGQEVWVRLSSSSPATLININVSYFTGTLIQKVMN